jgi:2-phosphosulfolactate phosphatase
VQKTVVIDFLPECVSRYRPGWAIVAVDVIRATTTAITAAAAGRRCFPVPTIEAALSLADEFENPLLAGESGGKMPAAFEIDNSPAELVSRADIQRPLVLVSSSGTKVIHEAAGCEAIYLGSFRNYSGIADYLVDRHDQVAIIGAGSLGEFREEDQICCAWIAAGLMRLGYRPGNAETAAIVHRLRNAPPEACLCSRSVEFLRRTGRTSDLEFILAHIDDLQPIFTVRSGEVQMIPREDSLAPVRVPAKQDERTAEVVTER